MSVREALEKHLSSILRASKATLLVLLSDESGLSIAKIGRSSDIKLDASEVTSVSAAAFSASEENWEDLGIKNQIVAFSFFEKMCLITIRIDRTLLTIVHDFNQDWPMNADIFGSGIYNLKKEIENYFGARVPSTPQELEFFSNNVRTAIYLFSMGTEIPFASYNNQALANEDILKRISNVLDSVQNPVFARYALVNPSGLTLDARDNAEQSYPITLEAFSANANVAFQKMIEEAQGMGIGSLVLYICLSGPDANTLSGIIAAPSGRLMFSRPDSSEGNIEEISLIGLFPLTFGTVPLLGESRNIVYSILEIIGADERAEKFVNCVNALISKKIQ